MVPRMIQRAAIASGLDEFLAVLVLTKFAVGLKQLGASEPWHLKDLKEEDVRGLGFKKSQITRLMRAAEALGYSVADASAVDEFLAVLDLTKFAVGLKQLGVSEPWHLKDLEEEDFPGWSRLQEVADNAAYVCRRSVGVP